ncbi:zinc finger protein 271-like isoform X2 [Bicyclus anynana]|uniref:Zinc finger protein 271-like isoform X2 n=1 Tax=Bicyclus anynana TaxID=110368 RepID=A0ABM3M3T8_BICAN|nr:zinc finger protein 271-like isoform X2 [Bicyclus anynana]
MQCCVPFCANTSDNASTSEGTRITFHRLPSEENLRAAWLRALGIQDHHLADPAVVCSLHFIHEDFYTTKSCVRQIRSDAIPSTVQMCMICLDSDSKLFLMSKHKLEEAYQQLTGLSLFQLCRGTNLKQTLCVLCAQRLINFSRFRDLCLRANSLMTDLLEQDEFITIQHKELMNCATKHLRCNLTRTTLGPDCCDLYIDHTDEEEQTAAEESVVGDGATLVLKREDRSDSMSNAHNSELVHEDDNQRDSSSYDCVTKNEYFDVSIKLEPIPVDEDICEASASCSTVTEHMAETESRVVFIKSESTVFGCTLCYEDFVQEDAYKEHMIMHLQNTACDASQVCEPRAAVNRSCDLLVLQNKTGSQRLNDAPPPAAGCVQATVAPLSARLATNNIKVETTEEAATTWKSEQILETNIGELDNQLSQGNTNTLCMYDINRFTNCVVQSCGISKKPKKTVLAENPRVKTHTGAKPYSCETCNYKTADENKLLRHKRTHTGEKPYSCESCSYKTTRKSHLLIHERTHTGEKPYSCDICNYTTSEKGKLLRHNNTHTGEKPFSCKLCNYKCALKHNLLSHMKTHTGEKPFSCETCNYKTASKSYLLIHERTHTGEKPYSCDICNYKTAKKDSLISHMKTHTGNKPYSCKICNYKCAHKHSLLYHMKMHTGEKPFSCETCNYKTASKGNLLIHKKTHTGEKPYSCELCDYKTAEKSKLSLHQRTHTGEKPFSCELCDHKCAHKQNLLNHIKTHTGEKPFSCETCDYKTASKNYLLMHKRTHTGEKPYSCLTCNYKTSRKSYLSKHERTHTGEKPYPCDMCNYKTVRKENLIRHIKTHTGEMP